MGRVLITTVVGLSVDVSDPQKVIHLVRGDYNTRVLRMVPVHAGQVVDLSQVEQAKLRLAGASNNLEINGVKGAGYVDIIPTEAMTESAQDWAAQLVLLNDEQETIAAAPFTVRVHGDVYNGDAVEHTDNRVTGVHWEDGVLVVTMADGETISAPGIWEHRHDNATDEADGFMSSEDKATLDDLDQRLTQDVSTTADVEFGSVTVGSIVLHSDGTITGARFS